MVKRVVLVRIREFLKRILRLLDTREAKQDLSFALQVVLQDVFWERYQPHWIKVSYQLLLDGEPISPKFLLELPHAQKVAVLRKAHAYATQYAAGFKGERLPVPESFSSDYDFERCCVIRPKLESIWVCIPW